MKANITMIRNLKTLYAERIRKVLGARSIEARNRYDEEANTINKVIMRDIEAYAKKKYPFLGTKLKCDVRHSSYTSDSVSLYFEVEFSQSPKVAEYKKALAEAKKAEERAVRELDEWEEKAIRMAVEKAELPPFIVE